MFDHIGVVVRDFKTAGPFYQRLLKEIGIKLHQDHTQLDGTGWLVFSTGAPELPFFVVAGGRPTFWREPHGAGKSPIYIAFRAPSRAAVDAFHSAGLRAGGKNNGDPGVRRDRYYCAFLIDADGNNVEVGVHADA